MIEATSGGGGGDDGGSGPNQCGVRHFLLKEHRKIAINQYLRVLRTSHISTVLPYLMRRGFVIEAQHVEFCMRRPPFPNLG